MNLSISNIRIPMPAPLDHVLIDGDFCNDTGRWRCERLNWIEVVDSVCREYFADNDDTDDRDRKDQNEKDLDSLKEIINREHFGVILEACLSAIGSGTAEEVDS